MDPLITLVVTVAAVSLAGGITRSVRDAWKRTQTGVPAFDQAGKTDAAFDMFFGLASGGVTYALLQMLQAGDISNVATGFATYLGGYAGADFLDGVLAKGIEKLKATLGI